MCRKGAVGKVVRAELWGILAKRLDFLLQTRGIIIDQLYRKECSSDPCVQRMVMEAVTSVCSFPSRADEGLPSK